MSKPTRKIDIPRLIIKIVDKVIREIKKAVINMEDKKHGKESPH